MGRKPRDIWRLGVGRTFQIAETFASLTVVENVQMALLSHDRKLFSMWRRAADHKRDEALALLDQVGMKAQADRPCSVLAYGDVKRVELAIAMANSPKLLLMDEPTAGMAPKERNSLMALTKQLVIERGMAVLFTEHSMDVVFAYADRMIVLARGRLIAQGKPLEIRDHPKVQEVYFGSGKTFEKIAEKAAEARAESQRMSTHETLLQAKALCAWYGAAQILYDVDLEVRRGEVVALDGPQRRRQVDHAEGADRHADQAPRRGALPGPRHLEERAAPRGAPGPGLRARRPPRVHRPHGDGEPRSRQAARAPLGRRHRCAAVDARAPVQAVPQPRRDAEPPGRPHERRRAADADRGAHADGQPVPGAARRAFRRCRAR